MLAPVPMVAVLWCQDLSAFEAAMAQVNRELATLEDELARLVEELADQSPARDLASRLCRLSRQSEELKASAPPTAAPLAASDATTVAAAPAAASCSTASTSSGGCGWPGASPGQEALKQEYYSAMSDGLAKMERCFNLRQQSQRLQSSIDDKLLERDSLYEDFRRRELEYCRRLGSKAKCSVVSIEADKKSPHGQRVPPPMAWGCTMPMPTLLGRMCGEPLMLV
mmetsp:Transcript_25712/g.68282  ORF Transcript_25712/g.68282 Transcript_25712/m.68282 type:complete len:225 (+) Transcript_25712:64-738(+)